MTNINETLPNIFSEHELREDEYINEADGLVYCSKCHTPRQCRHTLGNKTFTPFMMCQCQKEAYDKDEAERAHQEFFDKVSRLKTSGLQDKALFDYTFANDNCINPEMKYAHDYVEKWSEMKALGSGFLIWGDVGTGKTFFAGCIANALLEQGVPVLMTNFARILNTLTGMYSDDRNNFIDSLNQYSLLIIDDLGMERNSEFALEQIFSVIDSRSRSKKPLIVTTNLTLDELNNPSDLNRKRIYERVLERCVPLKINNQNIRKLNAMENMKQVKELFS